MMTQPDKTAMNSRDDREAWERAEVERSVVEARETEAAGLRMDEVQLRRYLNPSTESPYSLEYAFSLLGDLTGKTVLDFGCGSGGNAVVLRARGAHVLALDISPHLLDCTKKRLAAHNFHDGAEFLLASGHAMPIPSNSVDVVLGAAILHHLDLAESSAELMRILKPGGFAVFIEPVRDPRAYVIARKLVPNRSEDISPFEYPLTSKQLDTFRRGFVTSAKRRFILPLTSIGQILQVSEATLRISRKFDSMLLNWVPSLGWWATIEVFRVTKPA